MLDVYDIEQLTMEPTSKMKKTFFWTILFQYKANNRDESQGSWGKCVGLLSDHFIKRTSYVTLTPASCQILNTSYKQVTEAEAS